MKTEEVGQEFVEHHGIKGMKWGVRRERRREASLARKAGKEAVRREHRVASPVRVTDTIGRSRFSKTKLSAVGGEDHPAHEDAIKVAASQQKLRKSGVHTLSNKELQDMAQRMNLENQVFSLQSKKRKSIGQSFVDQQLNKALKDPAGTAAKAQQTHKRLKQTFKAASVAAALA